MCFIPSLSAIGATADAPAPLDAGRSDDGLSLPRRTRIHNALSSSHVLMILLPQLDDAPISKALASTEHAHGDVDWT